jgi:peroxiredoxin
MVLTETPICNFGQPAHEFKLMGIDNQQWNLENSCGEKGTLIMFICNHCPYVKAIQPRLVRDTKELLNYGIKSVAIMSNDPSDYPEDSFENMKKIAAQYDYPFPYLFDKSQQVARTYGAMCTPDFFGYNGDLKLQYRGRLDASRTEPAPENAKRDLFEAMKLISETGNGPKEQIVSMGCSIKWRE